MPNNLLQISPYYVDGLDTPGFDYERFQDKLDALPTSLLDLLTDAPAMEFVQSLTQKYVSLSVQGPDVARIIRDVVIGDTFIGDLPQNITRRLGIDPNAAREVANLIVSRLLQPVLEDIKKVQATKFPSRVSQRPSAPVSGIQQPRVVPPPPPRPPAIPSQRNYPGQDLPETGGNIIDLRNK
jgi:hypothetical protein